jgi:hypothetical protein
MNSSGEDASLPQRGQKKESFIGSEFIEGKLAVRDLEVSQNFHASLDHHGRSVEIIFHRLQIGMLFEVLVMDDFVDMPVKLPACKEPMRG